MIKIALVPNSRVGLNKRVDGKNRTMKITKNKKFGYFDVKFALQCIIDAISATFFIKKSK